MSAARPSCRVLLMDPKGKRVVFADNVTTPLPLKQAVAQCLFNEYQVRDITQTTPGAQELLTSRLLPIVASAVCGPLQVHSVTFLPAPLLALFTEGASAGVTVLVPNKQIGVNDNSFQERPHVATPLLLTGLVIDVGYLNAVVTPVWPSWHRNSRARARSLTRSLRITRECGHGRSLTGGLCSRRRALCPWRALLSTPACGRC